MPVQPYGMTYFEDIIQSVGNTPLVRLNRMARGLPALVLAKVESFNPGGSSKDRIGLSMIEEAEALTVGNRALELIFAFNYGARDELVRAVRAVASEVKNGNLDPASITETTITEHLDTATFPDPDLIIRKLANDRVTFWRSKQFRKDHGKHLIADPDLVPRMQRSYLADQRGTPASRPLLPRPRE